jgi:ABC-2 type transport system ATP-binding protein
MIVAENVIYDYPAARALHGLSFTVARGSVLALVGPNGAGKSTLMRCIAALDRPTEGRISVAGVDTRDDPRAVHAALGYLPDFFGLYDELSVRRALVYAARSRGVPAERAEAAALEAADRVDLTDRLHQRAGELSRGLRQRLAIAQTIVHAPQVLLLDEPAAGLDPEARRSLSDLIRRLGGEGMTILVSSHILAELEDYCTDMLMIRDGRATGGGVLRAGDGPGAEVGWLRLRARFAERRPDLAASWALRSSRRVRMKPCCGWPPATGPKPTPWPPWSAPDCRYAVSRRCAPRSRRPIFARRAAPEARHEPGASAQPLA